VETGTRGSTAAPHVSSGTGGAGAGAGRLDEPCSRRLGLRRTHVREAEAEAQSAWQVHWARPRGG